MVFTVSNVTNMHLQASHTAAVGVRTVPGPTIAPRWIVDMMTMLVTTMLLMTTMTTQMVVAAASPTSTISGIAPAVTSVECVRVSANKSVDPTTVLCPLWEYSFIWSSLIWYKHLFISSGDCDSDSDCKSGLYCFQRNSGKNQDVPGCSGGDRDHSATDYCTDEKQHY